MSVYKMCNDNCDKRFISGANFVHSFEHRTSPFYFAGYQGHCPRLSERFGQAYHALTHEALNEFTDAYRQQAKYRSDNSRFPLVQSTDFAICQNE